MSDSSPSSVPAAPGPTEPDELDELELHSAVMVRNFELLRRRSEVYGELGRAEYLLLRTLETTGPSDIGGLAKAIGLDPSTAGRQVVAMEADGLVARRPDVDDRRRSIVEPTAKGRDLAREVRARRRRLTAELLADWDRADICTLATMFRRWNEAITEAYLR